MGTQDWGQLLYTLLDILIKAVVPVVAGVVVNYLLKKMGREKFLLAKDIVGSIVNSIEQQYRSGKMCKEDRYVCALKQGIERTGLTEEQVAHLIQEAVFQLNVQIGKYTETPGKNAAGMASNNTPGLIQVPTPEQR